jgi:hypothetical protein
MPSQAHTLEGSDLTTHLDHYGALVDFTSVTPTTSSDTVGTSIYTASPTTSYHAVSFFL